MWAASSILSVGAAWTKKKKQEQILSSSAAMSIFSCPRTSELLGPPLRQLASLVLMLLDLDSIIPLGPLVLQLVGDRR